VVASLSGSALVLINVVTLHRARLVPVGMGDCLWAADSFTSFRSQLKT